MGKLTDTTISERNQTTIPKSVRNFLELEPGDRVEWHVESGAVVVRKREE